MRSAPVLLAVSLFLAPLASSCGDSSSSSASPGAESSAPKSTDPSADAPDSAPRSPKSTAGPRGPIDPAQVASIHGVVRFEGDPPKRKELSISGTGGCPDHPTPVLEESAIVHDGRLANVFVHVKDGLDGWDLPPPSTSPRAMNQQGCLYVPHVLGMRVGETLLVRNSDTATTHNVNIRSRSNESLNPVQPPGGQPIEWTPKKREIAASFECNLHPWMKAYVCVVDDPFHAVTAEDGSFTIEGLPPGDYLLEAWHEKFGKKTLKVALSPRAVSEVALAYSAADQGR